MPWNADTLRNSQQRVRSLDGERRFIQRKTGRVEPDIQSMAMGEAREFNLAVLHIDVDGFKELTRRLSNEQKLRWAIIFFSEMTHIIKDYNGIIDKYVGDQITALFGIQENEELASQHCLDCGLTMLTVIKYVVNPYFKEIGLPQFTCAVGMDFDETWIAKVGVHGDTQFTLVGNAVLVAAQILGYGGKNEIRLGEFLYDRLSEKEKGYCHELTHPDFNWTLADGQGGRRRYKYFKCSASWKNYPLEDSE